MAGPWELDFFKPAKPSFKKTPWILVRGNHEDCNRAHEGYSQMLATAPFSETCLAYEEPDIIALKDLTIVNFDSSSLPDSIMADEKITKMWTNRLLAINKQLEVNKHKSIWFVSHKPLYGLVKMGTQAAPTNINLKKYFEKPVS